MQKKDWKYMIATIKDGFWVNMAGTYGVASAQLYWGRLAAILTRLSYHLTPDLLWVLVFVDDFMAFLGQNAAEVTSRILMLFFTLLGCPISWHKNVLHPLNRWLGYMVDINEATVWLPEDKLAALFSLYSSLPPSSCAFLTGDLVFPCANFEQDPVMGAVMRENLTP